MAGGESCLSELGEAIELDVSPASLLVCRRDEAPAKLRVFQTLGKGAFATVYKAEWEGQVRGVTTMCV